MTPANFIPIEIYLNNPFFCEDAIFRIGDDLHSQKAIFNRIASPDGVSHQESIQYQFATLPEPVLSQDDGIVWKGTTYAVTYVRVTEYNWQEGVMG